MKKLLAASVVGTVLMVAGAGAANAYDNYRPYDNCRPVVHHAPYRPVAYRPMCAPYRPTPRPYVYNNYYRPNYGTGLYVGSPQFSFGLWR